MAKCERKRCRHEALPGSRWCKAHGYVGENYVPPEEREHRIKPTAKERRSLLDMVKGLFES